jgi:tetratricopeptide (TPR) repeat protein
LLYVACLQENYAEARRWPRELIARASIPTAKVEGAWLSAYMDYFLGREDASLAAYAAIRKQAEAGGVAYFVATVDWIKGFIFRDRGRSEDAHAAFKGYTDWASQAQPDNAVFNQASQAFFAAWVEVGSGRVADASARLAEIEPLLSRVDPDKAVAATFLYRLLSAEIALAGNDVERAIALGREIVFPDIPTSSTPALTEYNLPFLKDVLARAYWKKGDLDAAAAEYRKLMTIDPSNQVRLMIHPLYHYRLGRVLEEKGDRVGAAVEYRKFLEYWKDADKTHPELADARARLAALATTPR